MTEFAIPVISLFHWLKITTSYQRILFRLAFPVLLFDLNSSSVLFVLTLSPLELIINSKHILGPNFAQCHQMTYETSLHLRHSVKYYAKISKSRKRERDTVLEKQDQEKIMIDTTKVCSCPFSTETHILTCILKTSVQ